MRRGACYLYVIKGAGVGTAVDSGRRREGHYMFAALKSGLAVSVLGSALALSGAALAEDKTGTNHDTSAAAEAGHVADLAMAQDLYAYGVRAQDVLSVLTAAKITGAISTSDVEREAETKENEGGAVAEQGTGAEAPAEYEDMIAMAREMAAGNDAMLDMVADVEEAGTRGRYQGPSKTRRGLLAGRTDIFRIDYRGGYLAELAVVGDGDTDLDLVITDENGNVICKDTSYSDKLYCSWTPRWTGVFVVAVVNHGLIRNTYYLLTN